MFFKKIFIMLLLLCVSTMIFAEENAESANALSLDLFPLLKGFIATDSDSNTNFVCLAVSYERLVASHYSIGVNLDLFPGKVYDVEYMYFGLNAFARFYPMSANGEKFFLGASVGINRQTVDGKAAAEHGGFFGLTTSLCAGYKALIVGGLYIEPSMSYVLSKIGEVNMSGASVIPLGWQGGLRLGYSF